jgi:hypothetical protein
MSAVISARLEAQVEGIQSEASPGQTHETLPEKLLKQKGLRVWLKLQRALNSKL